MNIVSMNSDKSTDAQIEGRRHTRRKKQASTEAYILELPAYGECCEQIAFAAAIAADPTLLAAAEYVEKHCETEIPEKRLNNDQK